MGINAPFLDTPDEDLICQICHGVLDKPVTHCQQGCVGRGVIELGWSITRPPRVSVVVLRIQQWRFVLLTDRTIPTLTDPADRHTYCAGCIRDWMHRPKQKGHGSGGKGAARPHCPGCMLPMGVEVRQCVWVGDCWKGRNTAQFDPESVGGVVDADALSIACLHTPEPPKN